MTSSGIWLVRSPCSTTPLPIAAVLIERGRATQRLNGRTIRPQHVPRSARRYSRPVPLFEPIFEALEAAEVRYVTVGGVAVVLHGYARLTADLDLAVDLAPGPAREAIAVLTSIGFRPRAPVDPADFADPEVRERWVEQQGMTVFSMWDPEDPLRSVDLFVTEPIDFEELFADSLVVALEGTSARVASIEDLIRLKRIASRPIDLSDIEALEAIVEERENRSE